MPVLCSLIAETFTAGRYGIQPLSELSFLNIGTRNYLNLKVCSEIPNKLQPTNNK